MLFRAALLGLAAAGASAKLVPRDPSRQCAISAERTPAALEDDGDNAPDTGLRTSSDTSDEPTIEVDIYFHIVATSEKEEDGYVSDETLRKQLDVLNTDYTAAGISFNHADTDRTVSRSWALDGDEMGMKRKLRKGDYRDLNVYYITRPEDNALGYSTYPQRNATPGTEDFYEDGCVISALTVPGGAMEGYNLGRTTTHEVGHWFGLFHTFEGGCSGEGDHVSDTPAQAKASEGCPAKAPDSCPSSEGLDNIHNFMDYAFDYCMEEFTPGQIDRMRKQWSQVRGKVN